MSLKLDCLAFISEIASYSDSQRHNLASLNSAGLCVQQLHLAYSTPKQVCAPKYTSVHTLAYVHALPFLLSA